jgi:signal peptide peptidase SppA
MLMSKRLLVTMVVARVGTTCAFAPVSTVASNYAVTRTNVAGFYPQHTEYHAITVPSVSVAVDTSSLTQYLLETIISAGVPALFWVAIIAFAAKSIKGARESSSSGPNGGLFGKTAITELYDDLYGSDNSKPSFPMFGRRGSQMTPKNIGIPEQQYLQITKLNDRYNSYEYSLTAATQSKAKAASKFRSKAFDLALQRSINSSLTELTPSEKSDLLTEEKQFLRIGAEHLEKITSLQKQITDLVIQEEMREMDVEVGEVDAYGKSGVVDAEIVSKNKSDKDEKKAKKKKSKSNSNKLNKLIKEIQEENQELLKLELEFIRVVIEIFGSDRANAIRAALLGNIAGGGAAIAGSLLKSVQDRPLSVMLEAIGYSDGGSSSPSLFVSDFPGDVTASQVEFLREEVTAIIRASKPGDEALIILETGGGTVTGYGLAAAQLQRFKKHGMKLTICVEQVAASGGYMMSCVADKIIASPFAVLGSIGVISDLPNVYERLKKEGIEFQTITAGKYKRTLTPTKKITKEDVQKATSDVEDILKLFKSFVKSNRPSLDIDEVATGETWFGDDALKKGLCDEIKTVDDVLVDYVNSGFNVYQVKYDPAMSTENPLGGLLPSTQGKSNKGLLKSAAKWLARSVLPIMQEEISKEMQSMSSTSNVTKKYMIKDPNDSAERIRIEYE